MFSLWFAEIWKNDLDIHLLSATAFYDTYGNTLGKLFKLNKFCMNTLLTELKKILLNSVWQMDFVLQIVVHFWFDSLFVIILSNMQIYTFQYPPITLKKSKFRYQTFWIAVNIFVFPFSSNILYFFPPYILKGMSRRRKIISLCMFANYIKYSSDVASKFKLLQLNNTSFYTLLALYK